MTIVYDVVLMLSLEEQPSVWKSELIIRTDVYLRKCVPTSLIYIRNRNQRLDIWLKRHFAKKHAYKP